MALPGDLAGGVHRLDVFKFCVEWRPVFVRLRTMPGFGWLPAAGWLWFGMGVVLVWWDGRQASVNGPSWRFGGLVRSFRGSGFGRRMTAGFCSIAGHAGFGWFGHLFCRSKAGNLIHGMHEICCETVYCRANGKFREVFRGVAWRHPDIANFLLCLYLAICSIMFCV